MPGTHLVTFPESGHFPHLDEPRRFGRELTDFIEGTEPSDIPEARMRELLREGA